MCVLLVPTTCSICLAVRCTVAVWFDFQNVKYIKRSFARDKRKGQGAVHDKRGGKFSCCDLVGNEPQRDTPADRETNGRVVVVPRMDEREREKEGEQGRARDSASEFRGSRESFSVRQLKFTFWP